MSRKFSRRDLARLAGAGSLAALGGGANVFRNRRGIVGLAHLDVGAAAMIQPQDADRAVRAAIRAATGARTATTGLAAIFSPADVIGIKVNCLAGPRLSPRIELVRALARALHDAGIPAKQIIVFERSTREIRRAGYPIDHPGGPFRITGIDNAYFPEIAVSGSIGSLYARLVVETCTALISFGVVKDHDLAGVSAGLKNWFGVIHNPNKYHDHHCNPYVADVVNHPYIRTKLRLTVLDGVSAQYDGGPAWRPGAGWPLRRVAVSLDPVAIDAWAWKTIDAERVRRGLPTLEKAKRPPAFIATAARYGLGEGDPAKVREVP